MLSLPLEHLERFVRRERVGDVAEVDARDDLARRHVGEQLPQRLASRLRVQVPDGVDDRGQREVDDALLGPEPAQLRVGRERCARTPAGPADDLVERPPDDERPERADRRDARPRCRGRS